MKVAITADPGLPVPPRLYGGIERVIDLLVRGLCDRGHQVTLFADANSTSSGRLIPWAGNSSLSKTDTLRNAALLASVATKEKFDVIHSFSRLAYMTPVLPLPIPKIMSYQRAISSRTVKLGYTFSRGTLAFTAISEWMMSHVKHIGDWTLIPNGVSTITYQFSASVHGDAPLVFLGRIEEIKGPHLAVEIAQRAGRRLIIAGNIPEEKRDWVEAHVLRHVDGDIIRYIGPIDDAQKNAVLGSAAAFLMPILWNEPFGIVMAEALACGTPVLGLARGSVPEVVEHGVTGFVTNDIDGLVESVQRLSEIDRGACRARAEAHYSETAIVDSYERLYRKLLRPSRANRSSPSTPSH